MRTSTSKELREHIARANGYLRRNDVERAIDSICAALRVFEAKPLAGRDRVESGILISEFLRNLCNHQAMAFLLDPGNTGKPKVIPHNAGQEGKLRAVLEGLVKLIREKSAAALQQEAEGRLARKKSLIESGLKSFQEGQAARGGAFFKRVSEEFSEDKGIYLELARLLVEADQLPYAAEMFERAMEAQPREPAAYAGAVDAWMALHEYEKAEAVYRAVLRAFGGHPVTFGRMAKFYLGWRKKIKAEEFALRALQTDKSQKDALEVMAVLDGK